MLRTHTNFRRALGALALLAGLSGCAEDAVESLRDGGDAACASDKKTIENAVDVYYASGGAAGTATIDGLIAAGLLRAPSTAHVMASDGVTAAPIPGGPCDTTGGETAPAPGQGGALALSPEQCEADRATLQGAVDAFGAAYSISPMDESELVRAKLLLSEVQGYDLQGSTLVPVAGSCA